MTCSATDIENLFSWLRRKQLEHFLSVLRNESVILIVERRIPFHLSCHAFSIWTIPFRPAGDMSMARIRPARKTRAAMRICRKSLTALRSGRFLRRRSIGIQSNGNFE
jgi:hypothetical protein